MTGTAEVIKVEQSTCISVTMNPVTLVEYIETCSSSLMNSVFLLVVFPSPSSPFSLSILL